MRTAPVVDALADAGHDGEDVDNLFGAVDALRIPLEYLAELFTAGDPEPVRAVLRRLAAMRSYMRAVNLGDPPDESVAAAAGTTGAELTELYRLLAVAKYADRYVIPTAYRADGSMIAPGCATGHVHTAGAGGGEGPATGADRAIPVGQLRECRQLRRRATFSAPVSAARAKTS
jgi:nitrate reductase beta subunit